MKLTIARVGESVATFKDFSDIRGRGEICHFIAELEVFKRELVELFEQYDELGLDEAQTKLT